MYRQQLVVHIGKKNKPVKPTQVYITTPVGQTPRVEKPLRVVIKNSDKEGQYSFSILGANGEDMLGERYTQKKSAIKTIGRLIRSLPAAIIIDSTDENIRKKRL